MYTMTARTAAVIGARHQRAARNGQDAAASWVGDGAGAIAVCDGCGSGSSSEVGARLGAQLVVGAIAARLAAGERASRIWSAVQAEVLGALARLAGELPGDRARAIREHLLFTIVAAAVAGDEACVWAIGDGCYAFAGEVSELGPFADNEPPYLAYALLGMAIEPRLVVREACQVAVATDGIADLAALLEPATLAHADGLRRRLALQARTTERIDWDARRIARTPARLQDDGAVAVLGWQA